MFNSSTSSSSQKLTTCRSCWQKALKINKRNNTTHNTTIINSNCITMRREGKPVFRISYFIYFYFVAHSLSLSHRPRVRVQWNIYFYISFPICGVCALGCLTCLFAINLFLAQWNCILEHLRVVLWRLLRFRFRFRFPQNCRWTRLTMEAWATPLITHQLTLKVSANGGNRLALYDHDSLFYKLHWKKYTYILEVVYQLIGLSVLMSFKVQKWAVKTW